MTVEIVTFLQIYLINPFILNKNIVSTTWLAKSINDPNLIILDATFPAKVPKGLEGKCIKNAQYFDLKNKFSDLEAKFPSTFPSIEQFEKGCRELGIQKDSIIVIYDVTGIYTSPRVWWMFKTIGINNVFVLDGGLPKWIADGYNIVNNYNTTIKASNFKIDIPSIDAIRKYDFVKKHIFSENIITVDARSKGRFNNTEEDPRKELKSGHIPNSINIPYTEVLKDGCFKTDTELKLVFKDIIEMNPSELVFSCGSGITACILLLASENIISCKKTIYDGSWTEWATLEGLLK